MTKAYSNGDRYRSSEKLAKKLARNDICPGADKIQCTVLPTLEIISVKQGTGRVRRFMRKIVIFTGACHHINGVMRTVLRYLQLYKEPGDIYTRIHTYIHTRLYVLAVSKESASSLLSLSLSLSLSFARARTHRQERSIRIRICTRTV